MSPLIEHNSCIFDEKQLALSHGYEALDSVGQEAFVNHIHFEDSERVQVDRLVDHWKREMRSKWPDRAFRIYVHEAEREIIVRFHQIRDGMPHWSEASEELQVLCINATR